MMNFFFLPSKNFTEKKMPSRGENLFEIGSLKSAAGRAIARDTDTKTTHTDIKFAKLLLILHLRQDKAVLNYMQRDQIV